MKIENVFIGQRVIAIEPLQGVPIGSEGIVVVNDGAIVGVAWDFPDRPLPTLPPHIIANMHHSNAEAPYRSKFKINAGLGMLIEADAPGFIEEENQ